MKVGGLFLATICWSAPATASPNLCPPSPGLDRELVEKAERLREAGRQFIYGFVRVDAEVDEQRMLEEGVQLLGRHDDCYKARLPADPETLSNLSGRAWMTALGLAKPEDKLSPGLRSFRDSDDRFEVVINLFAPDSDGRFQLELESHDVEIVEFDDELVAYLARIPRPALDSVASLDFVLFIERERPTRPGAPHFTPPVQHRPLQSLDEAPSR